MEIQYILSKKPSKSSIYVFGSALVKEKPNDIDVLIVYDILECPPNLAYSHHEPLIKILGDAFILPIDITLLTYEEAQEVNFIAASSAIELDKIYPELTRAYSRRLHLC